MGKRPKIKELFDALSEELTKIRKKAEKLHEAAVDVAKSASASPSQSGDRFHAQGQADIAKEYVSNLEDINTEIEDELKIDTFSEIRPVCWVEVEYDNKDIDKFYYLSEPLALAGYKFVSSKSPFGLVLTGKKVGDDFEFKTTEVNRSGKIAKIE